LRSLHRNAEVGSSPAGPPAAKGAASPLPRETSLSPPCEAHKGKMERGSSAGHGRIHLVTGQMTVFHMDDACRIGRDIMLVSDHQ
jgi:hypothetical protein